jgi:hypothetical protein
MGNYHRILMKYDTQTKKIMLSSKVTKADMIDRFQDGRRRDVGNSSACYEMGNYHPISMKIGTQTEKYILSSKVTKADAYGKKQQRLNVKTRTRFKKTTLYEHEVIKSENFLFAGRSFHAHTTCS